MGTSVSYKNSCMLSLGLRYHFTGLGSECNICLNNGVIDIWIGTSMIKLSV